MNARTKRAFLLLFLGIVWMLFQGQDIPGDLYDDMDGSVPFDTVVYDNFIKRFDDFAQIEQIQNCPDSTVYFMEDNTRPATVTYPVSGATQITVSFYSTHGNYATGTTLRNDFSPLYGPIYFLGKHNIYSTNAEYPLYTYGGYIYMIDDSDKIWVGNYTTTADPFNIFSIIGYPAMNYYGFIQSQDPPGINFLENLGINIYASEGQIYPYKWVETTTASRLTTAELNGQGNDLYFMTVTAAIPPGTNLIQVSLNELNSFADSNGVDLPGHTHYHYSVLASVRVSGNLSVYDPLKNSSSSGPTYRAGGDSSNSLSGSDTAQKSYANREAPSGAPFNDIGGTNGGGVSGETAAEYPGQDTWEGTIFQQPNLPVPVEQLPSGEILEEESAQDPEEDEGNSGPESEEDSSDEASSASENTSSGLEAKTVVLPTVAVSGAAIGISFLIRRFRP